MTRLTKSLIVNASLLLAFPEHARTIVMGGMGAAMIRKHLLRKVSGLEQRTGWSETTASAMYIIYI